VKIFNKNIVVLNFSTVPFHHGLDLKTVMYGANIVTVAFLVPTTLMH
jgi:glyceraldehyde-3-phosphate dehydrogenase (NAD(P))